MAALKVLISCESCESVENIVGIIATLSHKENKADTQNTKSTCSVTVQYTLITVRNEGAENSPSFAALLQLHFIL